MGLWIVSWAGVHAVQNLGWGLVEGELNFVIFVRKACVGDILTTWLPVNAHDTTCHSSQLSGWPLWEKRRALSETAWVGHSLSAPLLVLPQQFPFLTEKWVRGSEGRGSGLNLLTALLPP